MTTTDPVPDSTITPGGAVSILAAVSQNDLSGVEQLLGHSPKLARTRNDEGTSLLLLAKYTGAEEIAKRILQDRDDLDIFEAAATGDVAQVQGLIAGNRDMLSQFSADGFTPLHLAAFFKHIGVVRLLLANGADVDAVARNKSAVRPIHSAAATRDARVVHVILAAGADPDAKQSGGHTALHSAVVHNNIAMATTLLAAGADPTITNDEQQSALNLAQRAKANSIKSLLQAFLDHRSQ